MILSAPTQERGGRYATDGPADPDHDGARLGDFVPARSRGGILTISYIVLACHRSSSHAEPASRRVSSVPTSQGVGSRRFPRWQY